jgi:hypothetical protein
VCWYPSLSCCTPYWRMLNLYIFQSPRSQVHQRLNRQLRPISQVHQRLNRQLRPRSQVGQCLNRQLRPRSQVGQCLNRQLRPRSQVHQCLNRQLRPLRGGLNGRKYVGVRVGPVGFLALRRRAGQPIMSAPRYWSTGAPMSVLLDGRKFLTLQSSIFVCRVCSLQ